MLQNYAEQHNQIVALQQASVLAAYLLCSQTMKSLSVRNVPVIHSVVGTWYLPSISLLDITRTR